MTCTVCEPSCSIAEASTGACGIYSNTRNAVNDFRFVDPAILVSAEHPFRSEIPEETASVAHHKAAVPLQTLCGNLGLPLLCLHIAASLACPKSQSRIQKDRPMQRPTCRSIPERLPSILQPQKPFGLSEASEPVQRGRVTVLPLFSHRRFPTR